MRVLTIGTFDTPHLGHAVLFKRCEQFGELTVGVNTDSFVESFKGKPPIFTYQERSSLIHQLGYQVVPNGSAGRELIQRTLPDLLVVGSDWARKDYYAQIDVTQDWLDERGIAMMYLPYTLGISSTELKGRLESELFRDRADMGDE